MGGATPEEQRWRVVVIEDSSAVRARLRRLLSVGSRRPYDIVEAADGATGLRAVLESPAGPPDCVIVGYHLSDVTCAGLLAALAAQGDALVCPVVVVTAGDDREIGREVLRAGAQDFVGKGWLTPESLTHAVENAVERWALLRERAECTSRLRLTLEATRTGIWSWDMATDAVTWTPECYAIHGFPEGEFGGTGAAFFSLVHPQDRAHVERTVRKAIEEHALYECDFRVLRPNGDVVWVANFGRATYDARGAPIRVVGTLIDITERKRAEALLRAREVELRTLADHSPDVMARLDRDLRHLFVNDQVEKLTGRPVSHFLGKTAREVGMAGDLCDLWEASIRSVFETGHATSLDFDLAVAGGLRRFASRMVPELGPSGGVEAVLAVADDRTEQRNAEDALRVSEDRLARAQRAARIGTWDWNVVTGEASWTEEAWRLFGHVPFSARVTFDFWLHSIHPEDRAEAVDASLTALRTGAAYHDEFRIRQANGTLRWVEVVGEPLLGADGAPVRLLGTVRDITERRAHEQMLRAAVDNAERAVLARDQLVSVISHDLRGPLNILVMNMSLLGTNAPEPERKILSRMSRQISRMNKMLNELLDLSQLHSGTPLELQLGEVELVGRVRELLEELQATAPAHRFELEAATERLVGTWDGQRLERVIENLLSNAVKYSPDGGRVVVAIEAVGEGPTGWAVVRVMDEGIGIAAKDRSSIFDWFSRAQNARSLGAPGIGIGLAGVRSIVEQHGGSITVESEERRGATFTLRLPTQPRAVVEHAPSSAQITLFR